MRNFWKAGCLETCTSGLGLGPGVKLPRPTPPARNWSLVQTAKAFLVTSATISSWLRRLDEEGPDALVQLQQPVNRFPDFIAYTVQTLKRLCPMMGKKKIAETLARAGLHLGTTTIGRMLKEQVPGVVEVEAV